MKKKKLLERLQNFFDSNAHKEDDNLNALKKILKKLKKKEIAIKKKIKNTEDLEEKKLLETEYEIIYAQRKKGILCLKQKLDDNKGDSKDNKSDDKDNKEEAT